MGLKRILATGTLTLLTACGGLPIRPTNQPVDNVRQCVQGGFIACIERTGPQYFLGSALEGHIPHQGCAPEAIRIIKLQTGEIAGYCTIQKTEGICRRVNKILDIQRPCNQRPNRSKNPESDYPPNNTQAKSA